jgi:hypothetical protein
MTAKTLILLGAALMTGRAAADDLRWTNTVRLSTLYQFDKVPPLAEDDCSAGLNCGYGRDFTQGRADWLSELEWSRTDYGLHAGLEARKDRVEPAASFIDPYEIYLHGTADLAGRPLTASIGRQSVIWGESLYFAGNGIAGAQAPIDATSGGIDATGYAAAHFLPVNQLSLSWQLGADVTLLAYQQFEWRRNRVDPEDAYAAAGDVLGDDHLSRIALYNPDYGEIYYDRRDLSAPPAGTDQFGLGLKLHHDEWDLGLYALQFDAKMPDLFYLRGVHTYSRHYDQGALLLGVSLAGSVGDATLGAEVSARRHAQLVQGGIFLDPAQNAAKVGPRGDTLHGQVSLTLPIEPIRLLPGGASWSTELAANHLLAVTADPDQLAFGRSRDAAAIRTVLAVKFYQVLPRVDLSVPLGLGWNFAGLSAVMPEMNRGSGDLSLGVAAALDQGWTASLTGTHYFGQDRIPIPFYDGRTLSNWDKIGASIQYSF